MALTEGALSDLRAVEMGQLLAGPFCGQLFADFGAEVIKLEEPTKGDPMRQWGREKPHGKSLWWPVVARNKKSATCNLRVEEGQALVKRLVAEADIVLENFRPGTLERWGLGFETLQEINPRLVLIRVTGFGQTGPYADRAGYGSIGEAMGGLRYVNGDPSTPPSRMGISIGDSLAGTFAALGGLMAVHVRQRTGRGQVVDSAIYEAVLALMESLIPEYAIAGYTRERTGAILPNVSPSNVYPTPMGRWCSSRRTRTPSSDALPNSWVAGSSPTTSATRPTLPAVSTRKSWTRRSAGGQPVSTPIPFSSSCNGAGVPAGRTFRAKDMLEDEHFAARGNIVKVPHPEFGELPMQGVAPRLTETPGTVRWAGPELGQHNDEIYKGLLGLDDADLGALRTAGVL
jgi:formyl-CoA transferase